MAHLAVFLAGWPVRWAGESAQAEAVPEIDIIEREEGGFAISTGWQAGGAQCFENGFDAAKGLADALIDRLIIRDPATVCMQAGSAQTADGLAVVLGGPLSGKSAVSLQLAAAGYRIYGDDRLAVRISGSEPPRGMCLGLLPKVHLPLPKGIGARLEEFVEAYSEVRADDVVYLKLWDAEAAAFGDTAQVAAVIELVRMENGPARLDPTGPVETLAALKRHCSAPHVAAEALHAGLDDVAGIVPGYRLQFSSSGEAAALIAAELGYANRKP